MTCNHKSHRLYRDATEGLYIQIWMASGDLAKVVSGAHADGYADGALEKGQAIARNLHKVDDVVERIAFGRSQYAEAEAEVNRHFDTGRCKNLQTVPA